MNAKAAGLLTIFFALIWVQPDVAEAKPREDFARFGALRIAGDGPSYLNLGLGEFDTFDENQSFAGHLEWRFGDKLGFLGPLVGAMINADGGALGYVGIYGDIAVGRLVITPQTGFGAYEKGDSTDLGGVFEFISGMTIAWRLDNDYLLGLRWEHISNGGMHHKNPGSNLILFNLGIPF